MDAKKKTVPYNIVLNIPNGTDGASLPMLLTRMEIIASEFFITLQPGDNQK